MRIACLNICRGLHPKAPAIEAILHNHNLDILGLNETDIPSGIKPPNIEGYQMPLINQSNTGYSRVAMYVKNELEFRTLPDF